MKSKGLSTSWRNSRRRRMWNQIWKKNTTIILQDISLMLIRRMLPTLKLREEWELWWPMLVRLATSNQKPFLVPSSYRKACNMTLELKSTTFLRSSITSLKRLISWRTLREQIKPMNNEAKKFKKKSLKYINL